MFKPETILWKFRAIVLNMPKSFNRNRGWVCVWHRVMFDGRMRVGSSAAWCLETNYMQKHETEHEHESHGRCKMHDFIVHKWAMSGRHCDEKITVEIAPAALQFCIWSASHTQAQTRATTDTRHHQESSLLVLDVWRNQIIYLRALHDRYGTRQEDAFRCVYWHRHRYRGCRCCRWWWRAVVCVFVNRLISGRTLNLCRGLDSLWRNKLISCSSMFRTVLLLASARIHSTTEKQSGTDGSVYVWAWACYGISYCTIRTKVVRLCRRVKRDWLQCQHFMDANVLAQCRGEPTHNNSLLLLLSLWRINTLEIQFEFWSNSKSNNKTVQRWQNSSNQSRAYQNT